jgi:hypothetical protein
MILLHPHKTMSKRMNKMKIKLMIKRKTLIKREMRMMGIIKNQDQSHRTQECTKPYKEITPWIIFLVISKGVTTTSCIANFYQYYSFVSSMKPLKVEDTLRDPNWVMAM